MKATLLMDPDNGNLYWSPAEFRHAPTAWRWRHSDWEYVPDHRRNDFREMFGDLPEYPGEYIVAEMDS